MLFESYLKDFPTASPRKYGPATYRFASKEAVQQGGSDLWRHRRLLFRMVIRVQETSVWFARVRMLAQSGCRHAPSSGHLHRRASTPTTRSMILKRSFAFVPP